MDEFVLRVWEFEGVLSGTAAEVVSVSATSVLILGLIALAWTDFREGLLPNRYIFPLAGLGLSVAALAPIGATIGQAATGLIAGLSLGVALALTTEYLFGCDCMGMGDAKFFGMGGAWVGIQGLNPLVFWSSMTALLWVLLYGIAYHKKPTSIRFGPFLALALAMLIASEWYGIPVHPAWIPFSGG